MSQPLTIVRAHHYVACYSLYKQQWALYVRVGSHLTFTRVGYYDNKPILLESDNAQQ